MHDDDAEFWKTETVRHTQHTHTHTHTYRHTHSAVEDTSSHEFLHAAARETGIFRSNQVQVEPVGNLYDRPAQKIECIGKEENMVV